MLLLLLLLSGLPADERVRFHLRDGSIEVLRRDDEAAGHDPIAHNFAGTIDIGEEALEGKDALTDAPLDGRPLGGGNDSGYEIEWTRSFLLSREREGHAPVGKHAIPHTASLFEVGAREGLHLLEQRPTVRSGPIASFEHVVETGSDSVVVEQITHDQMVAPVRYVPMSWERRFNAGADPQAGKT